MHEVSKETFFATVGKMDVHPTPGPDTTIWKLRQTGEVVGKSEPGYLGLQPKRWFVK